jgi:hypothetical protein
VGEVGELVQVEGEAADWRCQLLLELDEAVDFEVLGCEVAGGLSLGWVVTARRKVRRDWVRRSAGLVENSGELAW